MDIRSLVRDGKYYDVAKAISEMSKQDAYNAVVEALAEAERNGIELTKAVVIKSATSFGGDRLRNWGQSANTEDGE